MTLTWGLIIRPQFWAVEKKTMIVSESRSEIPGMFWNMVLERMEISWADREKIEVLKRVKEERNILHTVKWRKANWIGHILRRISLLKHVIEGKIEGRIEVTGRRGRRRKLLLDDLKEKRGFFSLEEEVLDRTVWRTGFGRGYKTVVRQTAEWTNFWGVQCGTCTYYNWLIYVAKRWRPQKGTFSESQASLHKVSWRNKKPAHS